MSIKGTMILAVVSFMVIILVAFFFFQFAATRHEEDMMLSKALGNLKQLITESVRLLDAYVVTGNEDYRSSFQKSIEGISENLKDLENAFPAEVRGVKDAIEKAGRLSRDAFEGKLSAEEMISRGYETEKAVLREIEKLYEKLNKRVKGEMRIGYAVSILGIVMAGSLLVMGMWMLSKIAKGFDEVLDATRDFSRMKFSREVKRSGVKELDEILQTMDFLAFGWSKFINRFLSMVRILDGTLRKMMDKVESFVADTNRLKDAIDGFVSSSLEVAEGMERLTGEVMDMVEQVEGEISDIESDTEREKENVVRIKKTLDRVGQMMEKVGEMGRMMDEVQGHVVGMVKMSEEISNFVETVTSIADQTNLLALNAAIEAARAGEAGKGFAVVAEEVRKLAGESRTAAERISSVTQRIVESIKDASEGFDTLKEEFGKIREEFEDIKGAFAESGGRLEGMADSLTAITSRLRNFLEMLRKSSEDVLRASENSKRVAEEAKRSSEVLEDMIEALKAMEKFTLVRDMFDQLAQQMARIEVRDLEVDGERIMKEEKELSWIFAGLEQVLGMSGFLTTSSGEPVSGIRMANPICASVDRSVCSASRKRLVEKAKDGDIAYGYCDAGMLHAFVPFKDDEGNVIGGIMMCGALPQDWRSRMARYSELSEMSEEEIEKMMRTRFTFSEEELRELAETIRKFLKGI